MKIRAMCLAMLAVVSTAGAYDATSQYEVLNVEGWTVYVNKALQTNDAPLCGETLSWLTNRLQVVSRQVPAAALAHLREIPFWLEHEAKKGGAAEFHPSRRWLQANGYNPEKAGGVEINNARNFLRWSGNQPCMMLHELAHGYHFRVLGADHAGLKRAFEKAKAAGTYESVTLYNGRKVRHYAMTNVKEYFAEGTEAYFGRNDFYPFVRAELKVHDPDLYAEIERVWGLRRNDSGK